jgi:hypothetical protein
MFLQFKISGPSHSSFDQLGFRLKWKEYRCVGTSHPLHGRQLSDLDMAEESAHTPGYLFVRHVPPTPSSFS